MHEGCKYIHSYFTNEARTVCIVVWESPSGEIFEDAIQITEDNVLWKELLAVEGVNEDVIHENTFRKNKEDRKAYEEEVVETPQPNLYPENLEEYSTSGEKEIEKSIE